MSEATQTVTKAKPEITVIKMQDGREVGFTGKRKMIKDVIVDGAKVGVRIDYRSGNTGTYWVPDHLALYSSGHGYMQKLGDNVAGMKNADDSPASEDDMQ